MTTRPNIPLITPLSDLSLPEEQRPDRANHSPLWWPVALLIALTLAVGACSDSDSETSSQTMATSASTVPSTTSTVPPTTVPSTTSSQLATTAVLPDAQATNPVTIDELGIATAIPAGWAAQGVGEFVGPDSSITFGAGPTWAVPEPTDHGFAFVASERVGDRTWSIHAIDAGEVAVAWAETEIDEATYMAQLVAPTARAEEIIETVGLPALEAFEVIDPELVRSALNGATVEVDDRTVAYAAGGVGPMTVVFEAGLGGGMNSWSPVADPVAESNRVFVYDRAGMGGSEPTPGPRDGLRLVDELRAVLAATGHEPPYVVVGHSLGGTLMELYARAYPEEVAGLVLVDSRLAGYTARCVEALGEAECLPSDDELASGPEPVQAEWRDFALTEEQVLTAPSPGPIPTVVLVGGRSEERPEAQAIWVETQRRVAESLGASFVLDEEVGHGIQFERPEMVLDAIDTVIGSIDPTGTANKPNSDNESEQP